MPPTLLDAARASATSASSGAPAAGPASAPPGCATRGELYLFQHALGGRGGGSVHLLEPRLDEAELERRLAGWSDVCGRDGSLEWLLARVQGLPPDGAPVPPARRVRRGRFGALRVGPAGAAA